MLSEEYIKTDYQRANTIYSSFPPTLLGRFTMSIESARPVPISLEEVYGAVFDTIAQSPGKANAWAKTFGALSVNVALNDQPTNFQFASPQSYKPPDVAEVATGIQRPIVDMLQAPEADGATTFLLATDEPATVEMALLQALHMVDTALVTNQYDGQMPLVVGVTNDDIIRIRRDFPDIFLRSYGNVRQSGTALSLLGSVIPTTVLEKSGIGTISLSSPTIPQKDKITTNETVREPAAFVGITTAKKPHIGHGFLLAKAIAEAGLGGKVLVELNDRGPRVTQALATLAANRNQPFAEVAKGVSAGTIGFEEIEEAYKERAGKVDVPEVAPEFSLSMPNAYYRSLLSKIMPDGFPTDSIADSELSKLQPGLASNPAYVDLFDGAGMALLKDKKCKAAVVVERGSPTLGGVLALLSTRYNLRLVDSPPPLSAAERAIFKGAGYDMEQSSGTGVMFDFSVASGTNGNVISLEELVQLTESKTGNPKLLLPAFRELMNGAYFLPSEGASLSANFAGKVAAITAFEIALEKVTSRADPYALLYEPLALENIKRLIVKELLAPLYGDSPAQGKTTYGEVRDITAFLPSLTECFSKILLKTVAASQAGSDQVIPKNLLEESDRQIIQSLRSATPDKAIPLLLDCATKFPDKVEAILEQSLFQDLMQAMGYDKSEKIEVLRKLNSVKGVYKAS